MRRCACRFSTRRANCLACCLPLAGGEEATLQGVQLAPVRGCPPHGVLKALPTKQVLGLLLISPHARRVGEWVLEGGPPALVRFEDGPDPPVVRQLVPGKPGAVLD